jgi:NhaA family Na+:H+ antiporter
MPLFALANAGVPLGGVELDEPALRVSAGVALGLVVGKPLGVVTVIALAVRSGLGALPLGLGKRHVVVLGLVAGVGFTMALFVAQLAFTDAHLLAAAKLGVLVASATAAVVALVAGRVLLPSRIAKGAAQSADEAESSTEL